MWILGICPHIVVIIRAIPIVIFSLSYPFDGGVRKILLNLIVPNMGIMRIWIARNCKREPLSEIVVTASPCVLRIAIVIIVGWIAWIIIITKCAH